MSSVEPGRGPSFVLVVVFNVASASTFSVPNNPEPKSALASVRDPSLSVYITPGRNVTSFVVVGAAC